MAVVRAGAIPDISAVSTFNAQPPKTAGEFLPAGVHENGVNLVVDKTIDFQDTVPQVPLWRSVLLSFAWASPHKFGERRVESRER
jgi:hypothetical protein